MTASSILRKYVIPLLVAAIALSVYMRQGGEAAGISDVLGFAPEGGQVVRSEDTHGGCHGDGHRFIVMDLGGESGRALAARLEASERWKPLPFDRTLTALAYGLREGPRQTGPYVTGRGGGALLPKIGKGYYFFKDRHAEAGSGGGEELLSRGSFNFTLSVFDAAANRLYYYELDT